MYLTLLLLYIRCLPCVANALAVVYLARESAFVRSTYYQGDRAASLGRLPPAYNTATNDVQPDDDGSGEVVDLEISDSDLEAVFTKYNTGGLPLRVRPDDVSEPLSDEEAPGFVQFARVARTVGSAGTATTPSSVHTAKSS